jgi:predicted metal-binding membrane protein
MVEASAVEALIRRDRAIIVASLVVMTCLSWAYLLHLSGAMGSIMPAAGAMNAAWSAADALLMLVMWVVMMTGMMIPSAAPMILLYGLVIRKQAGRGVVFAPTGAFAAGYLIAWAGFSVAATGLQWGLEQTGWTTSMRSMAVPGFSGALLIAAGLYQLTPLKGACLTHCRNPMEFLSRSWRPGTCGAVVMGLHHGLYCIGCCWALMLILIAGGVMNLLLVTAIAALVLIEKITPVGRGIALLTGGVAIAAGGALFLSA